MKKKELKAFLKSRNYVEDRNEKSRYFGDYLEEFSSHTVKVRLSSSKSFEMLDVCSVKEPSNWYDLALVKAMVNDESELNVKTDISILLSFLIQNLEKIEVLFDSKNYDTTKKELRELEKRRVSQMFPGLI